MTVRDLALKSYSGKAPLLTKIAGFKPLRFVVSRFISPSKRLARSVAFIQSILLDYGGSDLVISKKGSYFVLDSGVKLPYFVQTYGLALYQNYERASTNFVVKNLAKGEIFLDVGANVGWYSLHLAQKGALVYAFEPVSKIHKIVKQSIAINALDNQVRLYKIALSDKNSKAVMTTHNFGTNHLVSGRQSVPTETVQTRTLDSFWSSVNETIAFIKIDIEGAELLMLKGAVHTLKKYHPRLLVEIEGYSSRFGGSAQEVYDFLFGLGYRCKRVFKHDDSFVFKGSLKDNLSKGNNFYFEFAN